MKIFKRKLASNTTYIDSGNVFSRSLFLSELEQRFVLFVNDEEIKKYTKVFEELGQNLIIVDNYGALCNAIYNQDASYIINKNIFNCDLNLYKFEKDEIFKIKKDDFIEIDNIFKKASRFWI